MAIIDLIRNDSVSLGFEISCYQLQYCISSCQVSPVEVEHVVCTMDQVADAAVIGLPDEECGELPLAFVVKKPDVSLTVQEVSKTVLCAFLPSFILSLYSRCRLDLEIWGKSLQKEK